MPEIHYSALIPLNEEYAGLKLKFLSAYNLILDQEIESNLNNFKIVDNLKDDTKFNDNIYIVAKKEHLGIELSLDNFLTNFDYYSGFKHIIIDFSNEDIINKAIQSIDQFPLNVEYEFKTHTDFRYTNNKAIWATE